MIAMNFNEKEELEVLTKYLQGKEILEIGCGNGRLTFEIAKIAKSITGLDIDENRIETARERREENYNINFIVGSGDSLGNMEGDSFDVVFYSLSFHHVPINSHLKSLQEAKRVVRKNGSIILYEPIIEGQLQQLFLLFEEEKKELLTVYETVKRAKELGIIQDAKQHKISIRRYFDSLEELVDFFAAEYGQEKAEENRVAVAKIVGKEDRLALEDLLMVFDMGVNERKKFKKIKKN